MSRQPIRTTDSWKKEQIQLSEKQLLKLQEDFEEKECEKSVQYLANARDNGQPGEIPADPLLKLAEKIDASGVAPGKTTPPVASKPHAAAKGESNDYRQSR